MAKMSELEETEDSEDNEDEKSDKEEFDSGKSKISRTTKSSSAFAEKTKQDLVGLEEDIKEVEDFIGKIRFDEFLKPSIDDFSPVLERMPQQASLEQDLAFAQNFEADEKKDKEKRNYMVSEDKQDYNATENIGRQEESAPQQPLHINLETMNRNFRPSPRHMDFVNPELQAIQNQESETKYIEPEKIDMANIGRKKTLPRKVQKYEIR